MDVVYGENKDDGEGDGERDVDGLRSMSGVRSVVICVGSKADDGVAAVVRMVGAVVGATRGDNGGDAISSIRFRRV